VTVSLYDTWYHSTTTAKHLLITWYWGTYCTRSTPLCIKFFLAWLLVPGTSFVHGTWYKYLYCCSAVDTHTRLIVIFVVVLLWLVLFGWCWCCYCCFLLSSGQPLSIGWLFLPFCLCHCCFGCVYFGAFLHGCLTQADCCTHTGWLLPPLPHLLHVQLISFFLTQVDCCWCCCCLLFPHAYTLQPTNACMATQQSLIVVFTPSVHVIFSFFHTGSLLSLTCSLHNCIFSLHRLFFLHTCALQLTNACTTAWLIDNLVFSSVLPPFW